MDTNTKTKSIGQLLDEQLVRHVGNILLPSDDIALSFDGSSIISIRNLNTTPAETYKMYLYDGRFTYIGIDHASIVTKKFYTATLIVNIKDLSTDHTFKQSVDINGASPIIFNSSLALSNYIDGIKNSASCLNAKIEIKKFKIFVDPK